MLALFALLLIFSFQVCSNFVKFGRRKIGEIVRYLPNKKFSPARQTAGIAPKICPGQPATMYSQCSLFHPNPFTFGVNTAKLPRKVNPIFGRSLASSRIITTSTSVRVILGRKCTLAASRATSLVSDVEYAPCAQ